jgi:hypothetical protein
VKQLELGFTSHVRRSACIACMPFILCFIAFDILDLDRSDLIALSKNFEISSFVGDIDPTPRIDPFPEPLELPNTAEILAPDISVNHALLQFAEILKFSLIGTARDHGYRIGLARHSLSNASPDLCRSCANTVTPQSRRLITHLPRNRPR